MVHMFRHKLLTVDKYLAPYAEMELGMLYIKKQEFDKAKEHLLSARYSTKSPLK